MTTSDKSKRTLAQIAGTSSLYGQRALRVRRVP